MFTIDYQEMVRQSDNEDNDSSSSDEEFNPNEISDDGDDSSFHSDPSDNEDNGDDTKVDNADQDDSTRPQKRPIDDYDEEQEEDETVKAIIAEIKKPRSKPPDIKTDDFVTDLCFHPESDLLAVGTTGGDVFIYKYSNEENTLVDTYEVHTKAIRDVEFTKDGKSLISTGMYFKYFLKYLFFVIWLFNTIRQGTVDYGHRHGNGKIKTVLGQRPRGTSLHYGQR